MARQTLIQIFSSHPVATDQVAWLLLDNGQPVSNITHGTLAEAAVAAVGTKVFVTIPGESVFLTRQHLPGKNRQRLMKAIPFALEDQIIDDVDDMHFALGVADKQGEYWIAAVVHAQMVEWQQCFASIGLNPQAVIPDSLLLASADKELRLWCEAERTILVLPDQQRLVIDNQNLEMMLKRIMLDTDITITSVECYTADRSIDLKNTVAAHVTCKVNGHTTQLLSLFAAALAETLPVNLLQGDYSRREKRQHQFKTWYPAAAMLAIWIVARLVIAGIDNFQYGKQLDEIHAQQQQVYRQAFPTAKPGGDVYRKMQARLKEIKQRQGDASANFYHMLNQLAPTLSATSGLQIQAMRYREGRFELELTLPTLQSLDQLKTTLSSQQQWQVEIQSASSAKNHVEARLQIRGKA